MRSLLLWMMVLHAMHMAGQMVRIPPGAGDPLRLDFDPDFIRRNQVRTVRTEVSVKRDGEPMRPRKEQQVYRFNSAGLLVNSTSSLGSPGTGRDTTWVEHRYDDSGRRVEELRNDLHGWFALRDSLDEAGRTVRRTHVRIANEGPDRYRLVPGVETIISDERCVRRTLNDTAIRETWYNELGLPYRERTWARDRWGYLRGVEDRNIITGRRGTISLRYDEKGRLAERTDRPDVNAAGISRWSWRYDQAGNVVTADSWQDGVQARHAEYLYEEGTMLLKAVIARDLMTGLIHITRYNAERTWDRPARSGR